MAKETEQDNKCLLLQNTPYVREASPRSGKRQKRSPGWRLHGGSPAALPGAGAPYLTTCSRICRPKCLTMAVCVFSASFSPQGTQMGHSSLNSSQNWEKTGDTPAWSNHSSGQGARRGGGEQGGHSRRLRQGTPRGAPRPLRGAQAQPPPPSPAC